LELTGDFPAPLLPKAQTPPRGPDTRIVLADAPEGADRWLAEGTTREGVLRDAEGVPTVTIDRHPDAGYRVWDQRWGEYVVSRDGLDRRCAPAPSEPWEWQRLLVAQILPLASALQGFEGLHASGVEIDGRAFAFVGVAGAGKTTLALQLVLGGAGFISDDVVAIKNEAGHVMAHPGPAITSIRDLAADLVSHAPNGSLGDRYGAGQKVYRSVVPVAEAVPLGALYFLGYSDETPAVRFERIRQPDPRGLFAASFHRLLREPARLAAQLDNYAVLAKQTPLYRLEAPLAMPADELAESVLEHARATAASGAVA
jgi:hypothetical protein